MKLQFILRTVIDIKSHKNRNCWTCKHLRKDNTCCQPDLNKEVHQILNCSKYVYLRDYKRL